MIWLCKSIPVCMCEKTYSADCSAVRVVRSRLVAQGMIGQGRDRAMRQVKV